MATTIKPIHDRIVIRRAKSDEMKGGLHIPDAAQDKPQEGDVIAVGEGKPNIGGVGRIAMDIKVGDRVLFGKFSGSEIQIDDNSILILREEEILGIINRD